VRNLFKYCRHIEEDIFKCIVPLTPQTTPQALSDVELRILGFCHEERSALEIINFIGMNPDYIRKDIIPKLIEKDFLALTIPDKPRSPHQKYILTEAGMKYVKTM